MCLLLIAGSNSVFFWRALSGLLLLLLLVSGYALFLLGMRARAIVKRASTTKPTATEPAALTMPGQTAKMIERVSKPVLLLLVGFAIGVVVTRYALIVAQGNHRYSYSDVLVVARHDSTHYTLQPQWMKPWEMTSCSPMDWEAGQKMQFLNFKYHSACDDVEDGSFVFYSQPNGQRMIYASEVLNAGN